MPEWVLHFDGLYEPRYSDRGIATYGWQARHGDEVVAEDKGLVMGPGEGASANVAEFGALLHGLQWLAANKRDACPLVVRGDNKLAIETVAGRWNLSSARLLPLRDMARDLVARLGDVRLEKVGREENAEADRLSREAYHEAAAAHPEWGLGVHARSRRRTAQP
ncbi:MAG TPA: ribonuclease HI family protein [Candidatus Thermoplasmatota archaeon]|nr:ribonuclease HI family protein [Candidatus Thermoplasmatota archaeon]